MTFPDKQGESHSRQATAATTTATFIITIINAHSICLAFLSIINSHYSTPQDKQASPLSCFVRVSECANGCECVSACLYITTLSCPNPIPAPRSMHRMACVLSFLSTSTTAPCSGAISHQTWRLDCIPLLPPPLPILQSINATLSTATHWGLGCMHKRRWVSLVILRRANGIVG